MPGHGSGGKPKAGFPPLPQPLEIAGRFPHSHRPALLFQFQKGAWRPVASLPPPGSFLDENMLWGRPKAHEGRDRASAGIQLVISCGQLQLVKQRLESRLRAQRIVHRIHADIDQTRRPRSVGFFEPVHGPFAIIQPAINVARISGETNSRCERARSCSSMACALSC